MSNFYVILKKLSNLNIKSSYFFNNSKFDKNYFLYKLSNFDNYLSFFKFIGIYSKNLIIYFSLLDFNIISGYINDHFISIAHFKYLILQSTPNTN